MHKRSRRLYFGLSTLFLLVTCLAAILGAARIGYDRGYAAGQAQRAKELLVTRSYMIDDLLRESKEGFALIELLQTSVDPPSWEHFGGFAQVSWFEGPPPTLVITQTASVHEEIEAYLQQLRDLKTRNQTAEQ